jgi:hypothetical protein
MNGKLRIPGFDLNMGNTMCFDRKYENRLNDG